jgi:D-3-phosphoglycerate dehydrogenase
MSLKCLIIDHMHPSILPMLREIGITPDYMPDISAEEVIKLIPHYEGLILRSKTKVDKIFLKHALKLKFIARGGAGMDQIDVEEALRKDILLFNASEANCDAVGEHAMAILLALMNRICIADRQVRDKIWRREENRGYELKGKTVGIIGYGFMGRAFANKLSAFGCNVLAYDKYRKNYGSVLAKESSMEEISALSEIVSFHIPLNSENRGLIDLNYLSRFHKQFWLVNTSRGEILNTSDLIFLLQVGKIRGAALDVLDNEKLGQMNDVQHKNFDFLASSEQVVLTPHIAGWTYESYYKINEVLVSKIKNSNILYNF